MADRGWVCVSIAYRVSPRHTWPDHIVDVKRGLAWIKEHIAEYGGDPDFVAITGGSAGGHLAALAALTPNDPAVSARFRGSRHLRGGGGADLRALRLVLHRGPRRRRVHRVPAQKFVVKKSFKKHRQVYVDASSIAARALRRPAVLRPARPRRLADPGRTRRATSCATSRDVAKRPVLYAELPHAQHAFDMFGSPRGHYTAEAVAQFLSWVYAKPELAADPARSAHRRAGAIAVAPSVSSPESPAAERISMNACTIASVSFVWIVERDVVGEHRDVELVDVAPHRDVHAAAGDQRSDRIDLGDQRAADTAPLARTRARWRSAR